ncbi:hypothetical protein D3C73_1202050 [compost metagenome]
MHHAAVAVIGKFAQAGIGNDQQIGIPFFDQARRFLHNPVIRKSGGADGILRFRNTEQQNRRNTQRRDLIHLSLQHIQRKMINARHRADLILHPCSISHKYRLDKIQRIQHRLPHHSANTGCTAQTAVPGNWKTHWYSLLYSQYVENLRSPSAQIALI